MISYRHHVVSLIAVFLALAIGVTLGGGPLSDIGRAAPPSSEVQAQDAGAERAQAYAETFATASAPALYAGGLRDRSVSVLTLPGADPAVVESLATQIKAAGGSVSGSYTALPALVSAGEKSLVDTMGSQLMTQLESAAVAAEASTYDRIGQLLGLVMSSPKASAATAESVRQSLAGADLLTSPEGDNRSQLVLVVLGDDIDDAILSGLVAGLASKATGVVVAGDTDSGASGDLSGLRTEPGAKAVATVDGVETALGQVTTVLALTRSLETPGGSFGASGSDGAVPLG